jgi:enediyne biosynthesis protein E3
VRHWLKPLILPWLRRDVREIERQAAGFSIDSSVERERLSRLGRAFLGGYSAMLHAGELAQVARAGAAVHEHERPFFFEGAAMGYVPRGWYCAACAAPRAEHDLLALDRRFLYLYYVGLGLWVGFRHPRRPERIETLAAHLDPRYAPLCYDGYGFKIGFFDRPADARGAVTILGRCPPERRIFAWQGFGRAQHFVLMDDEPGFAALVAALGAERGAALECGRALAYAFTRVDRPDEVADFVARASPAAIGPRLLGVSWAFTARRMTDPEYFARCMHGGSEPVVRLSRLPDLCEAALARSTDYGDWQARTQQAAIEELKGTSRS